MPKNIIPFAAKGEEGSSGSSLSDEELYQWLPASLREVAQQHSHLRNYLRLIPTEEIGVPEYYTKLSRDLEDSGKNLIYPVSDDIFIHVLADAGSSRGHYIVIEPNMTQDLSLILPEVEDRLLDVSDNFFEAKSNEQKAEAILRALDKICDIKKNGTSPALPKAKSKKNDKKNAKVQMTPEQYEAVKYTTIRDKVGLGVIEPILQDPYVEDISQAGVGHMFIEHRIFKSLRSSICFETGEDLDEFVLRTSDAIGKAVTLRRPIVDATLPDGSRINIVFGSTVSRRGSNFSIRKFSDTPLSILDIVGYGSMTYEMAAYLSIVIEDGCNLFIVGEAASGKTSLMNAITTFIPKSDKIVSIEDTPELQVPHNNWIREIARMGGSQEKGSQVAMFDLLKAALRQRPNFIIVGEIRGAEGSVAFGAMQTGHAVMSTFHAANVEKVIQRLTGNPINIPKTYIDNLHVVVCMNSVKLPNGKMGRRATSLSEIVNYDPIEDAFSIVEVFKWNPATDEFEFVGNKNSPLLEGKIAMKRGYPPEKRWQIYTVLEKRARILQRLHKDKGMSSFYEFAKVLERAQNEGIF